MPDERSGEITNPRIRLEDVAVSEADCRRRTDKIMALQRETLIAVREVRGDMKAHLAQHQGAERKAASVMASIRTIGTIVAMAATMGAALWALARTIG